ncbi:hypothetical protein FOL47_007674 [Perkinsus chesapeaki]|uniref:Transmembrane protein 234 n=1 Tax=Perkinsus chesapeaki TaxID=330153 RepID=A0A7J6LJP9_PERCH|nr:hypothetical protein FOL47_007674 [Perkinsus chesapeaki]
MSPTADGQTFLSFLLVGFLWGATTPFLKEASGDSLSKEELKLPKWRQIVISLWHLLLRWKFLLAYGINQAGSIGYYYLLGSHDLSVAVPAANSLSFGFTALTEALCLNRTLPDKYTVIGSGLILFGVFLCMKGQPS